MKNIKTFVIGFLLGGLIIGTVTQVIASELFVKTAEYNDSKVMFKGEELQLDTPCVSIVRSDSTNGYMNNYLPVRALCEALGYYVNWDDATRTVEITTLPPPKEFAKYSSSFFEPNGFEVDDGTGLTKSGYYLVYKYNGTNTDDIRKMIINDWDDVMQDISNAIHYYDWTLAAEDITGGEIVVSVNIANLIYARIDYDRASKTIEWADDTTLKDCCEKY